MKSKKADAIPGCLLCHPLHAKGCQIVAQSRSTPKTVQSVQTGTHPVFESRAQLILDVIFVLSATNLAKICYFNLRNILTVDQCKQADPEDQRSLTTRKMWSWNQIPFYSLAYKGFRKPLQWRRIRSE
jgi:hypothetical protein